MYKNISLLVDDSVTRYERDKPDKFGVINVQGVVSIVKYSDVPKTIILCMKHVAPIHAFYCFRFYRS